MKFIGGNLTDIEWNKYVEKLAKEMPISTNWRENKGFWQKMLRKAAYDRQLSKYYAKRGINHAKLGR